jgi:hypothetical protein
MLTLRREQLDAFRKPMRERFAQQLAVELRERHHGRFEGAEDREVDAFVETCLNRAEGYQIRSRDTVRRFAHLMAEFGPDFDLKIPPVREVLRRFDLNGGQKLRRLERILTFGQW